MVRRAGFLVSDKSELERQRRIAWMGKALDVSRGRIAPLPSSVAAAVLAWVASPCATTPMYSCAGSLARWGGWANQGT